MIIRETITGIFDADTFDVDEFVNLKEQLIKDIVHVIEEMMPEDLIYKYQQGEIEHGEITESILKEMDLMEMLKDEVYDAFWYRRMQNIKDSLTIKKQ